MNQLPDPALEALLLLRFRSYLARGYDETQALLLAVGYPGTPLAA